MSLNQTIFVICRKYKIKHIHWQ